ncbi:MAG: GNAT family N-acetyltransferase [Fusobacteriaceae bacterium]|jgi:ribosomal protein S18 acetylase RimI-like enzyme|nr:GNAT family N-acetyltransferase [Fusobacteriaceae bacterium]
MNYRRTDFADTDFKILTDELDKYLWFLYPEIQAVYAVKNIVEKDAFVIVCFDNEEVVGCGCFRHTDEENVVELKRMYVKDKYRNMGIGENILNELEKWAKEKKNRYIILETGIKNIDALNLYKKYGFRITENYGYYKGKENSICMKKQI